MDASLSTAFVMSYPYSVLTELNMMVVRPSGATSLRDGKCSDLLAPWMSLCALMRARFSEAMDHTPLPAIHKIKVQAIRTYAEALLSGQGLLKRDFRYVWASCPVFTLYCLWVRGTANPADSISRLHNQFGGGVSLAREAATRRVSDLWASPDRKTVFLWTLGVAMGPFVLPQFWQAGLISHSNVDRAEFYDVFLQYRIEQSMDVLTQGVGWVVCCMLVALWGMPPCLHPRFFLFSAIAIVGHDEAEG